MLSEKLKQVLSKLINRLPGVVSSSAGSPVGWNWSHEDKQSIGDERISQDEILVARYQV